MKPIYAATFAEITRYLSANGYAPTVTEIAVALGISHNAARKRVLWLTECGLLTYTPRVHRGIALTGATVYRECKCGRPITDALKVTRRDGEGRTYSYRACRICVRRKAKRVKQEWDKRNLQHLRTYKRRYRIEKAWRNAA